MSLSLVPFTLSLVFGIEFRRMGVSKTVVFETGLFCLDNVLC
jgi:hypothetical protein